MLRLCVIFLLCTLVQVQGSCPVGYLQFPSGSSPCFSLKPADESQSPVTWQEASAVCVGEGGSLASIMSLDHQVILNLLLKPASAYGGAWIGLSDVDLPGTYQWRDGADATGYNNWALGEPDTTPPAGQRCVQMVHDAQTPGLWKTLPCDDTSTPYFFCEQAPSGPDDPVPPPCDETTDGDYFNYEGACFKIISNEVSFADAEAACQATDTNAHLATVNDAYYNNAVRLLLLSVSETSSWIGLTSSQGMFTWLDRSQRVGYTNWAGREPQPSETDSCVATDGDSWTTEDCSANKTAVCSINIAPGPPRPVEGECPDGWNVWDTDCIHYVSEGRTRALAQQECDTLYPGATLYAPHAHRPIDWSEYGLTPLTEFWLAMSRNDDDKYAMDDGSPVDYVNWVDGHPCCWGTGEDCVVGRVPSVSGAFEWAGRDCNTPKPFFCVIPSITAPPETGECMQGWFKLRQKCYGYFPEEVTFAEAHLNCMSKAVGGNLAAPSYEGLQDMLNYFMKSFGSNVWIGLWDTSNNREFRWSNGDTVSFTNWAPGQPDGYLDFFDDSEDKNDCAMMMIDPVTPGLWDDVSCSRSMLPYLCESYIDPRLTPPAVPNSCPPGFIEDYYGECYSLVEFNQDHDTAMATCAGRGGSLAAIPDGYQQGLLQFYLSTFDNAPTSMWIGINDKDGDGEYTNPDGSPVTYVNWGGMNSPRAGMCVAAQKGGKWLESDCTDGHASICNIPRVPVTPAPRETHCDEGWFMYEGNGLCYLINTYRLPGDLGVDPAFVSYADAKRLCATQGATLASVHGAEQNDWLYKVSRVTLGMRNVWLGLHRSTEGVLQWEDGSPVNYVFWDQGEPSSGQEGTDCVSLFAGNAGVGPWTDERCFKLNAFVCQKPANDGPQPQCEPGWNFGGSNCFYISPEAMSWQEADMSCNEKGSHLASLSNEVERRNLSNILFFNIPGTVENWPWIGFRRLPNSADFTWSDGTPTSSDAAATSWSPGQPDSADDDCAVIELRNGYELWNNINCGLSRPFLCKRSPGSPGLPSPPATTQEPPGGCQPDGVRVGAHCYTLDVNPRSWDAARTECGKFPNGDLASVPIYAVQALLSSLLFRVQVDNIWLGMISRVPNSDFQRAFHWIDGTPLTFTNWGSGQPSLPADEEYCVKILTDPDAPGKWYDDACNNEYSFVCKYDLDPDSEPVPPATFAPCPDGFAGAAPSCFRVETIKHTFTNAMAACEDRGGVLAPIMDGYESAFTELLMYQSGIKSAWVGLRSDEGTSGTYEWTATQWPKIYLNWAGQEPVLETGCAASVYAEGWRSMACTTARPSICRSNQDVPPTFAPVDPGLECPENWYSFNQHCYLIDTGFSSDNMLNSYFRCSTINAFPPSIHSRDENTFIRINSLNEKNGKYVWLGLVTQGGTYAWLDGSIVDFTNWVEGEETVPNDGKDCVVMVPELDGRWQRVECGEQAEIVCMLNEQITPTVSTTDQPIQPTDSVVTEVPPVLSTGAIVGISVGGGAVLVFVVIWICYYCEKQSNYRKEWEQRQRDLANADDGTENVQYSRDVELRKKKSAAAAAAAPGRTSAASSSSRGSEEEANL